MKTVHVAGIVNEVNSFTPAKTLFGYWRLEQLILKLLLVACEHFDKKQQKEIIAAIFFSAKIHKGIYRADKVTPYIIHTLEVACYIIDQGIYDHQLIIAAIIHDSVEDSSEKDKKKVVHEINRRWRSTVSRITWIMTKNKKKRHLYWPRFITEKQINVKWRAILLKVIDRILNSETFYLFSDDEIKKKVEDTLREFPALLRELGITIKNLEARGLIKNKKLLHISTRLGNQLQYRLQRYTDRR